MGEFEGKVVVVTGGAQGIGACIREQFEKEGAIVEVIDLQKGDHFQGDLSRKERLRNLSLM